MLTFVKDEIQKLPLYDPKATAVRCRNLMGGCEQHNIPFWDTVYQLGGLHFLEILIQTLKVAEHSS